MHAADALVLAAAGVAWLIAVVKASDLRHDPRALQLRLLVAALVALASAITLEIPGLYYGIGRLAGVPDLARLLVHALVLVGACAVQTMLVVWLRAAGLTASTIGHRWRVLAETLVLLTVLFALDPTSRTVVDVPDRHSDANPALVGYSLVFYSYFAYACYEIWRDSWRWARRKQGADRYGLRLTGSAGAIGTVFALHQEAHLILAVFHRAPAAWPYAVIGNALVAAAVAAIATGLLLPLVVGRIRDLSVLADRWYARAELRPLWSDLRNELPGIGLRTARGRLSVCRDHAGTFGFRGIYRMVIEINDGRVALQPYLDEAIAEDAIARCQALALSPEDTEAIADAAQLSWALTVARPARQFADRQASGIPMVPESGDLFTEELQRLRRLAHAYTHSDIVPAVVAARRSSQQLCPTDQEGPTR